jgi:nicotinamidase-related amidase
MKKTALILIDIQNDYFVGGAMTVQGATQAANNALKLLQFFRQKTLPVIHIQHETVIPEQGFMLPNTKGQQIHRSVVPLNNEVCITKNYPNSFWKTNLNECLQEQNIGEVVLAGMMTHMCVSTTARAAMERGYNVTVIQEACATRALELNGIEISADTVHKTALAEITMLAKVENLSHYLAQ